MKLLPFLALQVDSAVLTVWWIFLIVALIVTLVDVVLLCRLIQAALRIKFLAGRTLPSAVKIVEHTAAIGKLEATNKVAGDILESAKSVIGVAASIEQKLEGVARTLARQGG